MNIHQHYYQVNEQTLNCFPNLKDEAVRMAAVYNEGRVLNYKLKLMVKFIWPILCFSLFLTIRDHVEFNVF